MRDFRDYLVEQLGNQEFAAGYLNDVLEDGDEAEFLRILKHIAEGRGGMSRLAAKTDLNRSNLYRIFSGTGNPEIQTLAKILGALGFRLAVAETSKGSGRTIKKTVKAV